MAYSLNTGYSTACCEVKLNPLSGKASVYFWTGSKYSYRKVSRRAMVKAIAVDFCTGGLPSVGKWVNETLLA